LVLLHGFTGSPESWDGVRKRIVSIPTLAPVLPGHGPDHPVSPSFDENVDHLAAWIRESAGRAHVAGYSLGGRAALGILARHEACVESLTLISVHPGLATEEERAARRVWEGRWIRRLREEGLAAFVEAWERLPLFARRVRVDEETAAAQRTIRSSHDPEQLARSMEAMGLASMPDYRRVLERTATPVQVIVGGEDRKFAAMAVAIASANPDVRQTVIPRCGHNPLVEAPEELARAVEDWIVPRV
jgi:2-succinyl-6-hydroxy-2,4-cyclohexadiene-1-carboxylate synthase